MAIMQSQGNNFKVVTDAYDFSFCAETLRGKLNYRSGNNDAIEFSFIPEINDIKMDAFQVDEKSMGDAHAVFTISSGTEITDLTFHFFDSGFSYYFTILKSEPVCRFRYQTIRGSFFQVHNFDPDIHSYDIPYRIQSPLSISSRKKALSKFFQIDEGNYMMPPYLTALYTKEYFLGLGLLSIPEAVHPFDAVVGACEFSLGFDFGHTPQKEGASTPVFWVGLADSRQQVLSIYRKAVEQKMNLPEDRKPEEGDWWLEPMYTTWGDQVYAKHHHEGQFHLESGSDKYLNAELVDTALEFLNEKHISPRTIVLDEGWSYCLGHWEADDSKWRGSLKQYIKQKHNAGYRVVLAFNPFLVSKAHSIPGISEDFLIKNNSGELKTLDRSGGEYYLFDWSNQTLRSILKEKLQSMFDKDGLNADGLKISETKLFPEYDDQYYHREYGAAETFLQAVFRDIYRMIKDVNDQAPVFMPCLNPLFQDCFDIVRLGNISEVNHDLYIYRAETASYLMPHKPIDMDDWACYQKVIGVTTYLKALCGIPNLFSSRYRGDGRNFYRGAKGGHPVETSDEQFNVIASAEALYRHSKFIHRENLRIDFDSMTFQAGPSEGAHIRTYQGGNVLAVYKENQILFGSLLDGNVVIEIPNNFQVGRVVRILQDGTTEITRFKPCFTNKILIQAKSSRFNQTLYYNIKGKKHGK